MVDIVSRRNDRSGVDLLYRVAVAGVVRVRLLREVWQRTRRAAHGLPHDEGRSNRRAGVILGEVSGGDATSRCQAAARVARLDENVRAC